MMIITIWKVISYSCYNQCKIYFDVEHDMTTYYSIFWQEVAITYATFIKCIFIDKESGASGKIIRQFSTFLADANKPFRTLYLILDYGCKQIGHFIHCNLHNR